jgi:PadR family transcriptional regulator, regulatory protein PadR
MSETILREILLALWKVHILHHAEEHPIYGQWLLEELRRHGFEVSRGTLYPLLARMHDAGWLQVAKDRGTHASPKARREYVLTTKGTQMLEPLRQQVKELHREVIEEARRPRRARASRGSQGNVMPVVDQDMTARVESSATEQSS